MSFFPTKVIIVCLLAVCCVNCSRNYGIVKAHAYFRETVPGTIRTNEFNQRLGAGVRKEYLVFVESDSTKPVQRWSNAWVMDQGFAITAVEIRDSLLLVGKNKKNMDEVVLKAEPGNRLWQLVLTQKDGLSPTSVVQHNLKKHAMILSGNRNGKPFEYRIKKLDTLARMMMQ